MRNVREPSGNDYLPVTWVLMHDNDTKHASKVYVEVLDCLDLISIESLWNDMKFR